MGRTKMMGCGNTTCRHNSCHTGCQLKEIVLGSNGACLYFLPDVEKSKLEVDIEVELSTYAEAKAQEVKEAQRQNEPEARRIGFRVDD